MKTIYISIILFGFLNHSIYGQKQLDYDLQIIDTIVNEIVLSNESNEREMVLELSYQIYNTPHYYFTLEQYSESLYPIFISEFMLKGYEKLYGHLLALLILPDTAITKIQNYELPKYIKARLYKGDYEEQIINEFNLLVSKKSKEDLKKIKQLAGQLLYIDTPQSVKTFFEAFDSEIVYKDSYIQDGYQYYEEWSLFSLLLNSLYEYHPYSLFRSGKERYVKKQGFLGKETYGDLEPYYNEIEKTVYAIYGINIDIKAPFMSNIDIK